MIKVLHIVGARPQFIKLFPLYLEMKERGFNQKILHTGQHFDKAMSDIFFEEMGIPKPDYNLNIHSLSHGAMTGRMIEHIEKILLNEDFDYVIVYGDTNSTLAGSIAASKLNIKIIHIEAGVRNYDNTMPEEINRIITDKLSHMLFCPTDECIFNLDREGMFYGKNVGDLMYDAVTLFKDKIKNNQSDPYVLVTCHRQENTNKKSLTEIIKALNIISEDIDIIFPVHPRTKKVIDKLNITLKFKTCPPVSYIQMLQLINNSECIITDSGGVVREGYFLNKPSLVLLENLVWPEIPCLKCKPNKDTILNTFKKLKNSTFNFSENIFGNGNARKQIVDIIQNEK